MDGGFRVEVIVGDGDAFVLIALYQTLTNMGWDEGGPTRRSNRIDIQLAETEIKSRWNAEPYVVPAPETVWDPKRDPSSDSARVRLPDVTCQGLFVSKASKRRCAILWFQDTWAPPIAPAVRAHLRAAEPMFAETMQEVLDND